MKEFSFNQGLLSVFLVVGAIVLGAIAFNYSGTIQLEFGAKGLQLLINGTKQ